MTDVSAEAVLYIEGKEVWVYMNKDQDLYTVMVEDKAIGQIQAPAEFMDLYKQVYKMVEDRDLEWLITKVLLKLEAALDNEPEDIDDITTISKSIGWINCLIYHKIEPLEQEIQEYEDLYRKYL